MIDSFTVPILVALTLASPSIAAPETHEAEVVVYGGTSGAVMAAVAASREGRSVLLVSPDRHLGGLTSGGLGWTDNGHAHGIGGLAREFYQRVKSHYAREAAWKQQTREDFQAIPGSRSRNLPDDDAMWVFEPHVAEALFDEFLRESDVTVVRDAWLDREEGVEMKGQRILSITTLDGERYAGKVFIDATYEGDLMAAAGLSFHVGREANSVYGESANGVQTRRRDHRHFFASSGLRISPYRTPGDPESGLLPCVSAEAPGQDGSGDHRIQAYCFRACLTDDPLNRVPFPKPEGYDPDRYELLLRVLQAGWDEFFQKFDRVPNRKTDQNNHGPFSTDHIGANYDYPEASYERRREIIREHEAYQKGLMYFVANDPRVPENVRTRLSKWGLAKDEFTDNGNWSHQLYIREARRMVGQHVMTEHDCLGKSDVGTSIGMGVYTMDSHQCQRYVTADGFVENEGDVGVRVPASYPIPFGSILPREGECENLLVPVALSASHIAFGSIRMEPTFMILGQSAALAACLAIEADCLPRDLDYAKQLRPRLVAAGQRLRPESTR